MPAQYDRIKQSYIDRGKPLAEAKRIAAMTFIANGKGGDASSRAKSLHTDSSSSKKGYYGRIADRKKKA